LMLAQSLAFRLGMAEILVIANSHDWKANFARLTLPVCWRLVCRAVPQPRFERANTNNISYANGIGSGLVADLLPGWQLLFNGIPQTSVQFNPNPPPPFYEVYGGIFWLEI